MRHHLRCLAFSALAARWASMFGISAIPGPRLHQPRSGSSLATAAKLQSETRTYCDGGTKLEGYACWDSSLNGPRPGVLVAHTAIGPQEPFIQEKVHTLAGMGYVAMALDMFGAGKCVFGEDKDKYNAYLNEDRTRIQARSLAALEELKSLPVTDKGRTAAIGYCLGGKVALDLARAGPDGLLGVVSFHGILDSPTVPNSPFQAKVLACHGNLDPFISPEMLQDFQDEMERKAVDFQLVVFGGCFHAFTRPDKIALSDKEMGFQYCKDADRRSWRMCADFLEEVFL